MTKSKIFGLERYPLQFRIIHVKWFFIVRECIEIRKGTIITQNVHMNSLLDRYNTSIFVRIVKVRKIDYSETESLVTSNCAIMI